jgi:hypothetical protein
MVTAQLLEYQRGCFVVLRPADGLDAWEGGVVGVRVRRAAKAKACAKNAKEDAKGAKKGGGMNFAWEMSSN